MDGKRLAIGRPGHDPAGSISTTPSGSSARRALAKVGAVPYPETPNIPEVLTGLRRGWDF